MKKTDVYVVVDTPKKAKKLKRVLDMFGEGVYDNRVWNNDGYTYYSFDYYIEYWVGDSLRDSEDLKNKTRVSIKELRNILAKEHLKAGDVVFMRHFKGEYESILKIKGVKGEYLEVDKELFVKGSDYIYSDGQEHIKDFIRYATEEEKSLLEPKKELEAGRWYRTNRALFNHQNGYDSYGFLDNKWVADNWKTNLDDFVGVTPVQATPKEVEQALIEEANRRYNVGDKLSLFNDYGYVSGNGIYSGDFDDLSFCIDSNTLAVKTTNGFYQMVFNNGQWATVIEKDKFTDSDVAIVERLHDTLLDNHGYSLDSELLTKARKLAIKLRNK